MTALDLDAIRARAEAATPGPWTYGDIASVAGGSLYDEDVMIGAVHWDNLPDPLHRFRSVESADAVGRFIAAARTDIPVLIAEVERLTAENEALCEEANETLDLAADLIDERDAALAENADDPTLVRQSFLSELIEEHHSIKVPREVDSWWDPISGSHGGTTMWINACACTQNPDRACSVLDLLQKHHLTP